MHPATPRRHSDRFGPGVIGRHGPADLASAEAAASAVASAAESLGGLDVSVNNAGLTLEQAVDETSAEEFDHVVAVNLRAYFFVRVRRCRTCENTAVGDREHFLDPRLHREPRFAAYAATKGVVDAMTRALAVALAPEGVQVNAVAPGVVEVPRHHDRPGYKPESYAPAIPSGRVGRPADVAAMRCCALPPASGRPVR